MVSAYATEFCGKYSNMVSTGWSTTSCAVFAFLNIKFRNSMTSSYLSAHHTFLVFPFGSNLKWCLWEVSNRKYYIWMHQNYKWNASNESLQLSGVWLITPPVGFFTNSLLHSEPTVYILVCARENASIPVL